MTAGYRAAAVKAQPVKCVDEVAAVHIAGSAKEPVGYHSPGPATALVEQGGARRQHERKGNRLDLLDRLAERYHPVV